MRKSVLFTIIAILAVGAVALTTPATAKDTNNSSEKTTSSTVAPKTNVKGTHIPQVHPYLRKAGGKGGTKPVSGNQPDETITLKYPTPQ